MTGAADSGSSPRIEPFLVVYGRGPRSEDVARGVIANRCAARGVYAEVLPIDEIGQATLVYYLALVVVLPTLLTTDMTTTLRPFKHLLNDYRARRPHGLRSFWEGSCEWFAIGVVQVCGLRAIMQHPQTRALLDSVPVCAKHYIDEFDPKVDVFRPYDSGFLILPDPGPRPNDDVHRESIGKAWCAIQEWGVTDIQKVPRLRHCIDICRNHYENPRFSQLYRPIPRREQNRLDIMLTGPDDVVGDPRTWMDNGARVCRYVREQLQREAPELEQPSARRVQEQLRELYQNLRIVEKVMEDPGDLELPG